MLDTTEARQGNSKKDNLRVLLGSLLLALIVGTILIGTFWKATPPAMDAKNQPSSTTTQPTTPSPSPQPAP